MIARTINQATAGVVVRAVFSREDSIYILVHYDAGSGICGTTARMDTIRGTLVVSDRLPKKLQSRIATVLLRIIDTCPFPTRTTAGIVAAIKAVKVDVDENVPMRRAMDNIMPGPAVTGLH